MTETFTSDRGAILAVAAVLVVAAIAALGALRRELRRAFSLAPTDLTP